MPAVIETTTYQCSCDLCGHGPETSGTAVPEGWAQVYGPPANAGPPVPRKKLLCTDCNIAYKTFWRIEA